jgi:hypothetical protein
MISNTKQCDFILNELGDVAWPPKRVAPYMEGRLRTIFHDAHYFSITSVIF